jgi:cell division protein ZapE
MYRRADSRNQVIPPDRDPLWGGRAVDAAGESAINSGDPTATAAPRSLPRMTAGPLQAYRALRHTGTLTADPAQELAAEKLQSLHNALAGYEPASNGGGWADRFGLARRRETPPQGLYIAGPVGRGKSMLMDLFFGTAPVAKKRRVHFHAFMLEVHERLHRRRATRKGKPKSDDMIGPVAAEIAADAWLLCFDEFQVTNIADAMILGRLFEALFAAGVVVVATSNTPPDELYKDGLQRELFLPFIALIRDKLDLLLLDGGVDHRLARLEGMAVYHAPAGAAADAALDQAFAHLTDGAAGARATLRVQGRTLVVPRAARGVARFDFAELCDAALGAADYLALATHYHTLILSNIPRLPPERRNEARRFATLIDALYEHRVNLIASAEGAPDALCTEGPIAAEFKRTASRLVEMQSADYIDRPHLT